MVPGDQSMSILIGPGIVSDYTGVPTQAGGWKGRVPTQAGGWKGRVPWGLLAAHVSLVEAAGPDLQGTE